MIIMRINLNHIDCESRGCEEITVWRLNDIELQYYLTKISQVMCVHVGGVCGKCCYTVYRFFPRRIIKVTILGF